MEQSAQNPMQGLPGNNHSSMPPEFWNTLEASYPDPDQQLQQPPLQHELGSNQPSLGIDWDHPVFQQQARELAPRPDPSHGVYSSLHQPWQQTNSLQQAPQRGQINFDSRPLNASESSAFPQYPYSTNYFQQQPSLSDSFPEQHTQQRLQPRPQQQSRSSIPSYPLPQGYSSEMLQNTIDLTNDFPDSDPNVTINPQFLNSPQAYSQQQPLQNNFIQGIQQDFQRPGSQQIFDYYQNGIQVQHPLSSTGHPAHMPTGLPTPQVVITNKKPAPKSQTKKTTAKGAKIAKQTSSRSESESSDESELEIEAPDEPSPLPPLRPKEPEAAAQFDTVQAVWSPRNKWPGPEKVKTALVAYKDLVKSLRDAWKEQVQAMKVAENQGDNVKAAQLKEQVTSQRRMMDKIATTTLEMGHPNIVEKLGEHPMVVAALYSFLVDRFQATDFAGTLTINLLKLFARFTSLSEDLMVKTNLSKLLPKFIKKGGQQVKDLTQKILDNAAASTKRKMENDKATKEDQQTKGVPTDSAGVKRAREVDGGLQSGPKRMAVVGNPKDAGKVAPGSNKGAQMNKLPGATAMRPKPTIVAPKPSSLFGTLSSASKRPGTTNAERAAAAAAAKPNAASEKEKNSAPKPSFSFGDLMADLNKPKEAPAPKPVEDQPPETEEERTKRLRKEERRKLRVTWKPDDDLTEVRLFTHDPDEELGPGDGSMRSLGDVKGEGSVLKLHKDLDELEEEDLGGIREEAFTDDYQISTIDYDFEAPMDGNFIKRGGPLVPASPEKEAQDHREATTLMVFHTSPADMPDTPKEPPTPDPEEIVPDVVPFGELPDLVKARQERYYAFINPKPATPQQPQQPNAAGNGIDITNLLKIIQGGAAGQPPAPPPPPQPAQPDLEKTINMFRQQQPQAPPQMPTIPQAAPVAAPQPQGIDFNAILNVMKQMQGPAAFTQPQQFPPAMAPNLGAMFSQFNGQNQQHAAPHYPQQNYDYDDPERKRGRDNGHYDDFDPAWSRSKRTKSTDKPYKVGLVACKFWAEGMCRKGDNCTYRHDPL
ncbi:Zinc finger CCCH-type [Penicillium brevicompactum]|uniref:Zinc finger CCCH-type n=1 Tax=Penicillium brevicompactum TaxID=5074 RepID=A0A9W9QCQ2_PENBR|nr:Zinc finger CCCH-type [Penicillium brevicompactum]